MANMTPCSVPVRFWSPEHQRFYLGTMTSYHDESQSANIFVPGGPTFWIVPFRLVRRDEY
jgi:hypothetical protein